MTKISIYQVFTRLFGNTTKNPVFNGSITQNGVGKLNDFSDKGLSAIKDLGITHIWYTGIIEHANCDKESVHVGSVQHAQVVKGRAGSPYAITDYYDINPDLALDVQSRMAEFDALIKRTHKAGLKAIIDFVPNHVAREYASDVCPEWDFGINDDASKAFSPSNDFYYLPNQALQLPPNAGTQLPEKREKDYEEFPAKVTGNDRFEAKVDVNDWYETVKLNYGVDYQNHSQNHFNPRPPLWEKMLNILVYWAEKGVDGFRCDMAEMVPVPFWEYAIAQVKSKFPNVIFIAEVYNPDLYHTYIKQGGFDYLYDKVGLYDTIKGIVKHGTPANEISSCWQNLGGIDSHMLRFLENHDEQRIASADFAGNPWILIPGMLLSATMHKGPIMTYFGQEFGEPAHGASGFSGNDGRTTIFDYYPVPSIQKWFNKGAFNNALLSHEQWNLRNAYKEILNLSISNVAIGEGAFYDLMWVNQFEGGPDTRYLYAFLRYTKQQKLLILNYFNAELSAGFLLKIPNDALLLMHVDVNKNLQLKPLYGAEQQIQIHPNELDNTGVWISMKPASGIVFELIQA